MRVEQTSVSLEMSKKKEQELLDHFAGLAMQGLIANKDNVYYPYPEGAYIAKRAYSIADAMIKARKEVNNG